MSASVCPITPVVDDPLHVGFLAILPRIGLHGQIFFRYLKCPHRKEDALQEMRALAWKWYVRATEQGKDPAQFASALAVYAAKHVKQGRKLCGQEKVKDILSFLGQSKFSFTISPLPQGSSLDGNIFDEALHDNTQTPVDEQVCFRIDFPCWLATLGPRNREIALEMALNHRTQDLARKYGMSEGRISQLRRELHHDWLRFCNELPECYQQPTVGIA